LVRATHFFCVFFWIVFAFRFPDVLIGGFGGFIFFFFGGPLVLAAIFRAPYPYAHPLSFCGTRESKFLLGTEGWSPFFFQPIEDHLLDFQCATRKCPHIFESLHCTVLCRVCEALYSPLRSPPPVIYFPLFLVVLLLNRRA